MNAGRGHLCSVNACRGGQRVSLLCPPGSWVRGFGPRAGCTGQGELSPTTGTDTQNLSGCNMNQLCLSYHGARAWTIGGAGWLRMPLSADYGSLTLTFQWLKQVAGLSHREESWTAQWRPSFWSTPETLTSWYLHALASHIHRMSQTRQRGTSAPASVPCSWNSCHVWGCSGHPAGTPQGKEPRPHVPGITWDTSGQHPDLNLRRDHRHTETPT